MSSSMTHPAGEQSHSHRRRRKRSKTAAGAGLSNRQRLIAAALLLLLLLPLGLSWQRLRGAIMDYQTRSWLEYWQEQQRTQGAQFKISEAELKSPIQSATQALSFDSSNPQYMSRLATVYDWAVLAGVEAGAEPGEYGPKAIHWFTEAAQARPLWSQGWYDLALALARQGQLGSEFEHAISQALTLGPWEEAVQYGTADLGLQLYDYVKPPLQLQFEQNWQRMAHHQPRRLLQLANRYKALPRVCPFFPAPQPGPCKKI